MPAFQLHRRVGSALKARFSLSLWCRVPSISVLLAYFSSAASAEPMSEPALPEPALTPAPTRAPTPAPTPSPTTVPTPSPVEETERPAEGTGGNEVGCFEPVEPYEQVRVVEGVRDMHRYG